MHDAASLIWPRPREVAAVPGAFVRSGPEVVASGPAGPAMDRLGRTLARAGLRLRQVDGVAASAAGSVDIRLAFDPGASSDPEGYRLTVGPEGVVAAAPTAAGLYYAVATLGQWLEIHREIHRRTGAATGELSLPGVRIEDRPSFAHRGVLLDVSRNKVPTLATLKMLIEDLAGLKINQLQLYFEHTFAYQGHETVWRDADPLTAEEVRELDAWCRAHHVELVPNQNSFGHFHRWLVHEPYRRLAECPEGIVHPFSDRREPFSLCPVDPGSLELLADLYDQLLPCFESRLFNTGLDETLDLGLGRSAEACRERGKERVYLDFLRAVHALVRERGRRMMFWGDVILTRPELVGELPSDAVALDWGYEADHPFAEECRHLAAAGLDFYVCPGTSSWNSFAGRVDNAVANLAAAARAASEHGASGYLVADWGDRGHLQPLPVSYPGLLAGAGFAWNVDAAAEPRRLPLARLLDLHLFRDRACAAGEVAIELGNVYQHAGATPINGSALFFLLLLADQPLADRRCQGITVEALEHTLDRIDIAAAPLARAAMNCDAAGLIAAELTWVAAALRAACRLGRAWVEHGLDRPLAELPVRERAERCAELDALAEHLPPLWLARNRRGGLPDSLHRLNKARRLLAASE